MFPPRLLGKWYFLERRKRESPSTLWKAEASRICSECKVGGLLWGWVYLREIARKVFNMVLS